MPSPWEPTTNTTLSPLLQGPHTDWDPVNEMGPLCVVEQGFLLLSYSMRVPDGSTQRGSEGNGRRHWCTGGRGTSSQHMASVFSSFNCSINHCNKLFTAPNSLGLVGSKAKKGLGDEFPRPQGGGQEVGEHQAVVGEEQEEKVGSCGNCVGQEAKEASASFSKEPSTPSPGRFSLNFSLCPQPVYLLCLSDMLLTPSQQFCLGFFLLSSRASMAPLELPPSSEHMPELCYGFSHPGRRKTGDASYTHP